MGDTVVVEILIDSLIRARVVPPRRELAMIIVMVMWFLYHGIRIDCYCSIYMLFEQNVKPKTRWNRVIMVFFNFTFVFSMNVFHVSPLLHGTYWLQQTTTWEPLLFCSRITINYFDIGRILSQCWPSKTRLSSFELPLFDLSIRVSALIPTNHALVSFILVLRFSLTNMPIIIYFFSSQPCPSASSPCSARGDPAAGAREGTLARGRRRIRQLDTQGVLLILE